jgi:hypothetical protein
MNRERRSIAIGAMAAASTLLTGCLTNALLREHRYGESVSSILISADKKYLVFVGTKYHYIFDAPAILVKTIGSRLHASIHGSLGLFTVDEVGTTTGEYTLMLLSTASEQDRLTASELGFRQRRPTLDRSPYEYSGRLFGRRYAANGLQPGKEQRLNRTYTVYVSAEQSRIERSAKLLLTPLTLTVDGVLAIATVPLLLVAPLPTLITMKALGGD